MHPLRKILGFSFCNYVLVGGASERDSSSTLDNLRDVGDHPFFGHFDFFPDVVRELTSLGEADLASNLADTYINHTSRGENSLITARASLSEAKGDLQAAQEYFFTGS